MNEKQRNRWERIRAQGKGRYIILYGVLLWGVPTGLLSIALSTLLPFAGADSRPSLLPITTLSMTLFPLGGIAYGLLVWKLAEWQYHRG